MAAPAGGPRFRRLVVSADARRSEAVRQQLADTSAARGAFEARWTSRRLQSVAPELHQRLQEQIDIFERAIGLTSQDAPEEITLQGEATCRGWTAVTKAMEAAGEDDDAYLIGCDPRTGAKVAIGEAAQGAERVRQVHGDQVVWLTPDEVATLWGSTEGLKSIEAIKQLMPGAEVVDRRPADPAKWDSLIRAAEARDAAEEDAARKGAAA